MFKQRVHSQGSMISQGLGLHSHSHEGWDEPWHDTNMAGWEAHYEWFHGSMDWQNLLYIERLPLRISFGEKHKPSQRGHSKHH